MATARLIWDPPASGAWNMAVDDALLQTAADGQPLTLRFYQWSAPTLSLGYFQRAVDRVRHAPSTGCVAVRRATGGGAILHDRELTYSLVIPWHAMPRRPAIEWYQVAHQALIHTLDSLQVPAYLCPQTDATRERRFLCFQRRARGDVLMDAAAVVAQQTGRGGTPPAEPSRWPDPRIDDDVTTTRTVKIAGSAQRRRRDALLQHGSVLLDQSCHAPELPGILQMAQRPCDRKRLGESWAA